jgi:hypothetical protein
MAGGAKPRALAGFFIATSPVHSFAAAILI